MKSLLRTDPEEYILFSPIPEESDKLPLPDFTNIMCPPGAKIGHRNENGCTTVIPDKTEEFAEDPEE